MAFGTQTPPAGFPVLLGLLGLGTAWRNAGAVYGTMGWLGEVLLGAAMTVFLAGFAGYLVKFLRRPGVLADDLKTLPGRAGFAAMMMSWMLVAGALMPYAGGLARVVLIGAMLGHGAAMLVAIRVLMQMPPEGRKMTGVWHLTFVGSIVGAVVAGNIGWSGLAMTVFVLTALAALWIYVGTLIRINPLQTPPPLRPTLAIHLGPVSLFGSAALALGLTGIAQVMGWVSLVVFLILTARVLWLTAGGFSALWGAFTFPLAAFAALMVLLTDVNAVFQSFGLIALLVATLTIPPIAVKVLQLWIKGKLAPATNAASA